YPWALLRDGKGGSAKVRFVVNETGKVSQVEVVSATAPEFGRALAAAVELFEYEPALRAGRPCKALLSYEQKFEVSARADLVDGIDLRLLQREKNQPETIHAWTDVDDPISPPRGPVHYPLALLDKHQKG